MLLSFTTFAAFYRFVLEHPYRRIGAVELDCDPYFYEVIKRGAVRYLLKGTHVVINRKLQISPYENQYAIPPSSLLSRTPLSADTSIYSPGGLIVLE